MQQIVEGGRSRMIQFELFAAWGRVEGERWEEDLWGKSSTSFMASAVGKKELWLMALLIVSDGVIIARRSGVDRQVGWGTEVREQGVRLCEGGESGK